MKTNSINIDTVWPIYQIENECILSHQGALSFAYQVELPEIFTLSEKDFEELHLLWVKSLRGLGAGCVFHKQDWFLRHTFEPQLMDSTSWLSGANDRFFNERPYLHHRCFVYISVKPKRNLRPAYPLKALTKAHLVGEEWRSGNLYRKLSESCTQWSGLLNDSGRVKVTQLTATQMLGTKNKPGIIEQYLFLLSEHDQPLIKDINLKEQLKVGHDRLGICAMSHRDSLPSWCGPRINYDKYTTDKAPYSIGFASPLGMLIPYNHIYNQVIELEDTAQTIKRLESKRLRLQSLSAYSRDNAMSQEATNDYLNEIIGQQRQPVKAHFHVITWSKQDHDFEQQMTALSSAFAQMDATAKAETDGAAAMFWSGIPGNMSSLPHYEWFDTFAEQAVCFLNMESSYKTSNSPVGVRLGDRLSGEPLDVDLSDEPMKRGWITNRNKFILGPSGSGKSFFTNHMVRAYYEQGTHVVLVDVGHSYQGLCELVNGYYFTYDEDHPLEFNPFVVNGKLDTEKKESLKTLLLALWKRDDEPFSRSEYVALSTSLQQYYEYLQSHEEVFPCFNSYYEFLINVYQKRLIDDSIRAKGFDIEAFLYVLRPYYRGGEFDYLLNGRENLDLLDQPLIVFELDNIKDHPILFPIVTLIIMEVFIQKMRKLKGIRKMILIEEAWKAIAKEGMAEYIKYLFKTVRKFYGEAVVVTQEVEDIISSPVVKQAIINNADCKILLDQSKYQNKFHQIQELLGLTDQEKYQVLSINKSNDPTRKYKEVFISLGGVRSKVYATEVSLEEYFTYTTEESEKMAVAEYARRFGGLKEGISQLVKEKQSQI